MAWTAAFGIALTTAIITGIAGLLAAERAAPWLRISSFEGASGYFIGFAGVAAFVSGFGIGLLAAFRWGPRLGFVPTLGAAVGTTLALIAAGLVAARVQADVAPRIDGGRLHVLLELQWPATQREFPAAGGAEPYFMLGSVSGGALRRTGTGILWVADSTVAGHWTANGAAHLFTDRGRRLVEVIVDGSPVASFLVPLPARPSHRHLEWSDWAPAATSGEDGMRYRFRVDRVDRPLHVETWGPFTFTLRAEDFSRSGTGPDATTIPLGALDVEHNGRPFTFAAERPAGRDLFTTVPSTVLMAAPVPAAQPTLFVRVMHHAFGGACYLLTSEGGEVSARLVGACSHDTPVAEITGEPERFQRRPTLSAWRGRLATSLFESDRLYMIGTAVLDTRTLEVHSLASTYGLIEYLPGAPPCGLSPDARWFVRFGYAGGYAIDPVLFVTDLRGENAYNVPVDVPLPAGTHEAVDVAWVLRYFEWRRDDAGEWRLTRRDG